MGLHLVYCDTRRDALNELHMQRFDIERQDPNNPPTLHDENGLVGRITGALGMVDCYAPTWDEAPGILPGSKDWSKNGCRWAVLLEVDESWEYPVQDI